jgi:hypothetical protein
MSMRRALRSLLLCLPCAGCWDFADPQFPEAGAPAVLQVSAFVDERGQANITALLLPGLTRGGFKREVPDDTLRIFGLALAPDSIFRNGDRQYHFIGTVGSDPLAGPLTIAGPVVDDIVGPPTGISWFGIRKDDPDTISWSRGTELVLRIDTTLAPSIPPPQIQYWFLDLNGGGRTFRLSSDGLPPAEIHIPTGWVPEAEDAAIVATMTFYQSGLQRSPSLDYIGNIAVNVQIRWIIKILNE